MSLFRSIVRMLTNQPFVLHMNLTPQKVQLTVTQGNDRLPHQDLLKERTLPPPLVQCLAAQPKAADHRYLISLPAARQLAADLRSYKSDEFQLDTAEVNDLHEVACPPDFSIHWRFNALQQTLTRTLHGADGYLGEGWFFRGLNCWQPALLRTPDVLHWLDYPVIPSSNLHRFAAQGFAQFRAAGYQCDLKIETNFQVKLHIIQSLKRSLDLQIVTNLPQLQPQLATIQGDAANLISGTTILPGWSPKLRGKLLKLARSDQPMRFADNDLLAFIQDDLTPAAAALNFDLKQLRATYRIEDAALAPLHWTIEHDLVQGIGRYSAVPHLQTSTLLLPIASITQQLEYGKRFIAAGDHWLEFTDTFKVRYADWQRKHLGVIPLLPPEIMGATIDRLAKLGLQPPPIEVPNVPNEHHQAALLIDTMRRHGLPVGIEGLQQEAVQVIAEACQRLLQTHPRASILWLGTRRKRPEIVDILRKLRLPFTEQTRKLDGFIHLATPDNLTGLQREWTLIIFSELDVLAAGKQQGLALAGLRRIWSISTFTHPDWYQDATRGQRLLHVLGLTRQDLKAFRQICVGTYTKQVDTLLTRLVSPFKQILFNTDPSASEGGDVPIPRRQPADSARPTKKEVINRPNFSASVTTASPQNRFLEQAKHLANYTEHPVDPVPFMQYWPTYDAMTHAQQRWYFYWRSQARQRNYLPTDLSYLFLHVYEILHLVGVQDAETAFDDLKHLWMHYRALHPKLDGYLIDWIADFCVVYKLARTPLEWYATALDFGGRLTDQDLAVEAWRSQHSDISQLPDSLLAQMSDYQPAKSKFVQQHKAVEKDLRESLRLINQYVTEHEGKSLLERYHPAEMLFIQRHPFTSAIYEGQREVITIATVPAWHNAYHLRLSITAILKYTENLLRRQRNFKGTLRGIILPAEWMKVLEAAFPMPEAEPKTTKRRSSGSGAQESSAATETVTPLTIDYSKVSALASESDEVRSRLLGEPAPTEASLEVIPETSQPAGILPTLNIERPADTPAHLLTDLEAVHEVIAGDYAALKMVEYLKRQAWEVQEDAVHALLAGEFLSVVLDRINERALARLGDQLIIVEGDLLVVTEDYRDELEHLLSQPPAPSTKPSAAAMPALTDALTPEWAGFVQKMQPQHWEVLNALLMQEDVTARLNGIARSVYTTADLLIDEINEAALSTIGDIVIEVGDLPTIEAEDLEALRSLMTWALENVIREA